MLKVKIIPLLSRIASKIDTKPIVEKLKAADIFKEAKDKNGAIAQLKGDKVVELGCELLPEILPQLGAIGEDIPTLIALHYGVSVEEAGEKNLLEALKDIFSDSGITSFFKTALQKKAEQGH